MFCALTVCALAQTGTIVSPSMVPSLSGTFYLMSDGANPAPYPFDLYPGCTVYSLGDDNYLIDDRNVAAAKNTLRAMSADDISLDPSDPGDSTNSTGSFTPSYSFPTNELWIELTSVDSSGVNLTLQQQGCEFYLPVAQQNKSTSIRLDFWTI